MKYTCCTELYAYYEFNRSSGAKHIDNCAESEYYSLMPLIYRHAMIRSVVPFFDLFTEVNMCKTTVEKFVVRSQRWPQLALQSCECVDAFNSLIKGRLPPWSWLSLWLLTPGPVQLGIYVVYVPCCFVENIDRIWYWVSIYYLHYLYVISYFFKFAI